MQLVAARWFHAASVLYLLFIDVLYALKLLEVLSARTDLLWAHYRGLGLQFFTVWSQVRLICTDLPVSWDVTPCSLLYRYQYFRELFSLQESTFFYSENGAIMMLQRCRGLHAVTSHKTVIIVLLAAESLPMNSLGTFPPCDEFLLQI
jgi:hypothetical protein